MTTEQQNILLKSLVVAQRKEIKALEIALTNSRKSPEADGRMLKKARAERVAVEKQVEGFDALN